MAVLTSPLNTTTPTPTRGSSGYTLLLPVAGAAAAVAVVAVVADTAVGATLLLLPDVVAAVLLVLLQEKDAVVGCALRLVLALDGQHTADRVTACVHGCTGLQCTSSSLPAKLAVLSHCIPFT